MQNFVLDKEKNSLSNSTKNPLSDYIILGPLGRGAASFVYKIQSRKDQKELALKVIDKKQGNFNTLTIRLQNEIKIHSNLNHDNIIKMIDYFEDSDNFYMLLEMCEEGEFYSYLKAKGRLDEGEIRFYGLQLAKALKYLHEYNVLHRDIKLGNLLLNKEKILKLCDFGLAVRLNDKRPERDTLCGTPNYISPEIINKTNYGFKSDCWSFGCVIYAMATGNPPFEAESVQKTLFKIKQGTFDLPSFVSPDLKDLLKSILNWDSDKRFNINQIINHVFFTGNKFSFCVPSNNNQNAQLFSTINFIPNSINSGEVFINKLENKMSSPQISTPELVKTREKLNNSEISSEVIIDQKTPAYKENKQANSTVNIQGLTKNYKSVSSSVGSKAFIKNFENKKPCVQKPDFLKKIHKPSFDNKENLIVKDVNFEGHFKKNCINKGKSEKSTNKSIELIKKIQNNNHNVDNSQNNDDLTKYVKTEMDSTPKSKKTIKNTCESMNILELGDSFQQNSFFKTPRHFNMSEPALNPRFLLLTNNNNVKININTSKIMNSTNNKEENIQIISPTTSLQEILLPLSTARIKPCKFNTKNGTFEIKADHTLQMEISNGKLLFLITGDGKKIFIAKKNDGKFQKTYNLFDLPQKYHIYYNYCKKVCDTLKQEIPLSKISNEIGKFSLSKSGNTTNFEANFCGGYRIFFVLGSNKLTLCNNFGEEIDVDIKEKLSNLEKEHQKIIKTSFNYMEECLRLYEKSKEEIE